MPPYLGTARMARVCTGLTVAGGALLVPGLATGVVGAASRAAGGSGWQPVAAAAGILIAAGMCCGAGLVVAAVIWHASLQWRPSSHHPLRAARFTPPPAAARQHGRVGAGRVPQAAGAPPPPWAAAPSRVTAGPLPAAVGSRSPANVTGPQPRVDVTGPQPRVDVTGPQPVASRASFFDHEAAAKGQYLAPPPRAPELAHQPTSLERSAAVPTSAPPPTQQKMAQLKNLYREAEAMGEAAPSAHWEDLRERQRDLIRQYFEQAGLAGGDLGQPQADGTGGG